MPSPRIRDALAPRIRDALGDDSGFLREMLYEALFVPSGEPPLPPEVVDAPEQAHYYEGFGDRTGDVGRVAVAPSGALVGAAWVRLLTHQDPGYGYLDDDTPELALAVVAPWRDHGVGSALLADLLDEVGRCSLSVDRLNPAVRLYQRAGFHTVHSDEESLTMLWDNVAGGPSPPVDGM